MPSSKPAHATRDPGAQRPHAVLVGVQLPGVTDADHAADLAELGRLVGTLGFDVSATVSQRRDALAAAAVLGEGKLKELAALTGGKGVVPSGAPEVKSKARSRWASASGSDPEDDDDEAPEDDELEQASVVVVDHELTPSQARNLERATGAQVLDRTGRHRRHLPPPRAQPRGAAGGRDRPPDVRRAPVARVDGRQGAPARQGSRRGGDRARPAQDPRPHRRAARAARGHPEGAREPAPGAARSASRGARRLHERRQVVADACADGQPGARRGQALRHPRHDRARAAAGDQAARARLGHGGLHQEAPARPRRVVPFDPRRGARGVAPALRGRRRGSRRTRPSSR